MGKAYFISDLHLGASYLQNTRARERHVVKFLDSISEDVEELYLLGDILDYWYEYRYVVPRGYVRFFGKLAEMSDRGVKITWIIGNHDIWIFDYIPDELGVKVVDGTLDVNVLGKCRMVMAHGDGVWQRSVVFKIIRSIFRNRVCQWLYAAIHPRWTVPFAYRWSSHSRASGADELREREQKRLSGKAGSLPEHIRHLVAYCNDYTHRAAAREEITPRFYLFGHLHELVRECIDDDAEMLVIGDWLTKESYAVYDSENESMRLEMYRDTP